MTATTHPTAEPSTAAEPAGSAHGEGAHAHPSESKYVVIALVLALITIVEVGLSYWKNDILVAPLLLIGMALKFGIVVAYFMHLRFDSRVFRRLFVSGISLAVFCYVLVLALFHSFTDEVEIRPQGPAPVVTAPVTLPPLPTTVPELAPPSAGGATATPAPAPAAG